MAECLKIYENGYFSLLCILTQWVAYSFLASQSNSLQQLPSLQQS